MNSITGNNKIGVKLWEFAFQEFLEEHKRRFLEFGATFHECSIPTHYNLQLIFYPHRALLTGCPKKKQKSEFWNVTYPSGFHRLDEPPEKISAL